MSKAKSPSKSKRTVTETVSVTTRTHFTDKFFEAKENSDLQIALMDKCNKIDNLSSTLVNLNMKLVVTNDLKTDV